VRNGEQLKRRSFLDDWWVFRALTVADISGSADAGLGVMAQNPADGMLRLQIRHAASGAIARNYAPRAVFINDRRLNERDLRSIETRYGIVLSIGNFWYDRRSGLWGFKGGPALGIIAAQLDLGSRRLPEDASNGNTGVFFNGRELHQLELAFLQQVFGFFPAGRYYLNADGIGGLEGGEPLFDLGLDNGGQNAYMDAVRQWAGSSILGASGEFDTQGNWSVYSSYVGGVGGTPDGCIYTTFSDWAPPGC
jgi:hypothetical protein